jgi:hypothetical protein
MRRFMVAASTAALLTVMLTAVVGAREFGTVYANGEAYRTFANPARVDPGTGRDPIISFTNFEQGGVAKFGPGQGSHGGRWQVWAATWVNPADAHLLTDFDDVMALVAAGEITLERMPEADFRCPILPNVK